MPVHSSLLDFSICAALSVIDFFGGFTDCQLLSGIIYWLRASDHRIRSVSCRGDRVQPVQKFSNLVRFLI